MKTLVNKIKEAIAKMSIKARVLIAVILAGAAIVCLMISLYTDHSMVVYGFMIFGLLSFMFVYSIFKWKPNKKANENFIIETPLETKTDSNEFNVKENTTPIMIPDTIDNKHLKYEYEDVFVAYSSKYDLSKIKIGSPLGIKFDPSNEYDKDAIAVTFENEIVGFFSKNKLRDMVRDYLNNNRTIHIIASKIEDGNLFFDIGFYLLAESGYHYDNDSIPKNKAPDKIFKILGSSKADCQDTLINCDEGDEVDFDYDYIDGKAIAYSGGEIGYISESQYEYLESLDDYSAFIHELTEGENDKYSVKVAIYKN